MAIRLVDPRGENRDMTIAQLATMIGGSVSARTTQRATYRTNTLSPTIYYTALASNGISVVTPRTTSGVTQTGPLYGYDQPVTGLTDFIAVWDEGIPDDYVAEWIVVDT